MPKFRVNHNVLHDGAFYAEGSEPDIAAKTAAEFPAGALTPLAAESPAKNEGEAKEPAKGGK